MKKRYFITAVSVILTHLGTIAPAATIYCVHDDGLNDSQFCMGSPLPFPSSGIFPIGPLYQNCDIEALDLDEDGEDLFYNLYAASGDDTPRPGHLYLVNKVVGAPLWDLGDIWEVDPTGKPIKNIREVDALSVNPATHILWGWGQHTGLFFIHSPPPPPLIGAENEIDPQVGCVANEPEVGIIGATVVFPAVEREIEDITWNRSGTILYGVENLHNDPVDSHGDPEDLWPLPNFDFDFDDGIRLWAYDTVSGFVGPICPSLVADITGLLGKPAEIEGLEVLPRNLVPPPPGFADLLLVSFHGPHQVNYAAISVNFASTPPACQFIWDRNITTDGMNDIEGLTYDPFDPYSNG